MYTRECEQWEAAWGQIRQEARRDPRGGEADSTLVARARVVAVWVGGNGRPTRTPGEVRDAFGNLEAPEF
ncbi:MAG: hypothetical protein VYA70_01110 [Gemmatimonadota bacterium]|nr:hypothetical protein [Gemmatimonadota bacterium]